MKRLAVLLTLILAASFSFAQVIQTDATLSNENKFSATNFFLNGLDPGPVTFSQLGFVYATGTTFVRCTDCQQTNPCLGGGSGSFALYINGSWSCTTGGGTGSGFTTAAEVVAAFSGCSDADYLGADTACHAIVSSSTCVNAAGFSGSSIVEQIQAAVTSLGGSAGCVTYPPGQYTADDPSNWQSSADSYISRIGVLLGSGQSIIGPGTGSCITVNATGAANASLIANLNHGNPSSTDNNIGVQGVCVQWNVANPSVTPQKLGGALYFEDVSMLTVANNSLIGNPNAMSIINDTVNSSYHDNYCGLNTNDSNSFYGNYCLGVARFNQTSYMIQGLSLASYNNTFQELYNGTNQYSLLVLSGVNISSTNDRFDLWSLQQSYPYNGNAIETGPDNFGDVSANITIKADTFLGGSGSSPLNTSYLDISESHYYYSALRVEPQGNPQYSVATHCIIKNNEFFGLGTAANAINVTPSPYTPVDSAPKECTISDNYVEDQGIFYYGEAVDGVVMGNVVKNAQTQGIQCIGCRKLSGNVVINPGQTNPTSSSNIGITIGSAVVGITPASSITDNTVIDDQAVYSTGTVCTVPSATSTTCQTSGTGRWLYLSGGTWSQGWTNRSIYIGSGSTQYYIRNITPDNLHAELNDFVPFIPSGTAYSFQKTTRLALQLNTNVINFSNFDAENTIGNTGAAGTWLSGVAMSCASPSVGASHYSNIFTNSGAFASSCPTNYFVPPPPNQDLAIPFQLIWIGNAYEPAGIWTPQYNITLTGIEVSAPIGITCATYPTVQLFNDTDPSDLITLNGNYQSIVPLTTPQEVAAGTLIHLEMVSPGSQCSGGQLSPTAFGGTATSSGANLTWASGSNFSQTQIGSNILYNNALYTVTVVDSPTVVTVTPTPGTNATPLNFTSSFYAAPPTYQATVHYVCTGCN